MSKWNLDHQKGTRLRVDPGLEQTTKQSLFSLNDLAGKTRGKVQRIATCE